MKIDLGLSDMEAGALITVMTLCIAIFSYPIGFLMDRWSRKKSIAIMAIVWSVFTFVTGLGKNFLGVLIPRALVGVGEAAYVPGSVALISAAYAKEKRGRVLSVGAIGSTLGLALGMVVGGVIAANMGWRYAMFIFAIPGIIFGLLALTFRDYKTIETRDEMGRREGIFRATGTLFKIPTLPWLWVAYALALSLATGLISWLPAYMIRSLGIKEDMAGSLMAIMMVSGLIGIAVGAWIADMWQKKKSNGRVLFLSVCYPVSAALCLLLILSVTTGNIPFIIVSGILFSITYNMGLPGVFAVGQDVVPPANKVLVSSMLQISSYVLAAAWAPMAIGALSDLLGGGANGLKIALLINCCIGIIPLVPFLIASKHYAADVDKVKDIVLEAE
jgi:MFS family permease